MVMSAQKTVAGYLAELPAERRKVIAALRTRIRKNLKKGYTEEMGHGMITYVVPLKANPDTYNGEPLCYVALAAQKNNYALYLMGCVSDPKRSAFLATAFKKAGKKLDMGKSCLRFKSLDDLELGALDQIFGWWTPAEFVAHHGKVYGSAGKKAPKK